MNYPDAETLAQSYASTHRFIWRLTRRLSHEDSLRQPPYEGNCLNWVLGHILARRNLALTLLGATPIWTDSEEARYLTGSSPITQAEQALALEKLLADLDLSQQRIAAALAQATPAELGRPSETDLGSKPIGQQLAGLHWHETYHTGQLELLREVIRTANAAIPAVKI